MPKWNGFTARNFGLAVWSWQKQFLSWLLLVGNEGDRELEDAAALLERVCLGLYVAQGACIQNARLVEANSKQASTLYEYWRHSSMYCGNLAEAEAEKKKHLETLPKLKVASFLGRNCRTAPSLGSDP